MCVTGEIEAFDKKAARVVEVVEADELVVVDSFDVVDVVEGASVVVVDISVVVVASVVVVSAQTENNKSKRQTRAIHPAWDVRLIGTTLVYYSELIYIFL
jgi:hypothetical protein